MVESTEQYQFFELFYSYIVYTKIYVEFYGKTIFTHRESYITPIPISDATPDENNASYEADQASPNIFSWFATWKNMWVVMSEQLGSRYINQTKMGPKVTPKNTLL